MLQFCNFVTLIQFTFGNTIGIESWSHQKLAIVLNALRKTVARRARHDLRGDEGQTKKSLPNIEGEQQNAIKPFFLVWGKPCTIFWASSP
jgi:hypothetical protein